MFTAVFFTERMVAKSYGVDTEMVRHELETGKSDMFEAIDMACANGADPMNTIHLIWKEV